MMGNKAARKAAARKGKGAAGTRTKVKAKAKRSHLESAFAREWARQGGPELEEEFRFHPVRKWRADFAHHGSRTLIEIEGGANGGRHTRISGFKGDLDKYLTAHLHGWTVVRIGAHQVRKDVIAALIGRLRGDSAESSSASEPCGHCTQGYVQDSGFTVCNHCGGSGRKHSAESMDARPPYGSGPLDLPPFLAARRGGADTDGADGGTRRAGVPGEGKGEAGAASACLRPAGHREGCGCGCGGTPAGGGGLGGMPDWLRPVG